MTDTERADALVAKRARDRGIMAVIIVALVLSLGWNAWQQVAALQRAHVAEASAVSLAQQVQEECDTNGELRLDGRDLCDRADEVVEDPAAPPVPPPGKDGKDAPPPTDEQVDGAVKALCSRETCAVPPTMAQVTRAVTTLLATGEYDGEDGEPGKDAPPPDPGQLQAMAVQAVLDYCAAGPQCDAGQDGDDGPTVEEVQAMVAAEVARVISGIVADAVEEHCAAQPGGTCEGGRGADSTVPGPPGTARPGTYICTDGEVVVGFTVADDGAVELSCQALPPVIGPPTPSPTPTS